MKKSLVTLERAYHGLLMQIPTLVDALSQKHPRAPEQFIDWLKQAEATLKEQNNAKVAELAAIRSGMLAKALRDSSRKAQQQRCAEAISEAQAVVQTLYLKVSEPIEDARKILAPLLEALAQSRAVVYNGAAGFQVFIENIDQFLNQHEQLKANMVPVNALLNRQDRLWLLADLIDLEHWPQAESLVAAS